MFGSRENAIRAHRFLTTTPRTYEQGNQRALCRRDIFSAVFLASRQNRRANVAVALETVAWLRRHSASRFTRAADNKRAALTAIYAARDLRLTLHPAASLETVRRIGRSVLTRANAPTAEGMQSR